MIAIADDSMGFEGKDTSEMDVPSAERISPVSPEEEEFMMDVARTVGNEVNVQGKSLPEIERFLVFRKAFRKIMSLLYAGKSPETVVNVSFRELNGVTRSEVSNCLNQEVV